MSSETVIHAKDLCKYYNVYETPSDRLKQLIFRQRRFFTPVEAVKDVDVEIFRGETFGIVGRNGSGKSTLLQLICGTILPSIGSLDVRGKVSALLELGTGFNPEFTGRDNVYLSGSIMGLTDEQVDSRFQEIADFADIGSFIEQPVKNYSSGMYARLAFAVAINVDADILIVDEVLSVGDEAFQRKCFARIHQLKESGCTILFVSHAAGTILELCDRAMLMDRGECLLVGPPKSIVALYQRMIFAPSEERERIRNEILEIRNGVTQWPDETPASEINGKTQLAIRSTRDDRDRARFDEGLVPQSTTEYVPRGCHIENPNILDLDGSQVNVLLSGQQYEYVYDVRFATAARRVRFGMLVKTISGYEIGGLASHPVGSEIANVNEGRRIRVRFRFRAALNPAVYFMNAGVMGDIAGEEGYLHRILDAVMFRVQFVESNCVTGLVDFSGLPFCVLETTPDGGQTIDE